MLASFSSVATENHKHMWSLPCLAFPLTNTHTHIHTHTHTHTHTHKHTQKKTHNTKTLTNTHTHTHTHTQPQRITQINTQQNKQFICHLKSQLQIYSCLTQAQ